MARSRPLYLLLSMGALLAVGGCQTAAGKAYQLHDPRIVGTWMVLEKERNEYPEVLPRGEKSYFADGSACGYIFSVEADGHLDFSVFRSHWEVKDGKLNSTVLASNDPYLPSGEVIVDDIVSVDAHVLHLRETDDPTANVYARYRSPVDQGQRLCQLFDTVMGAKLPADAHSK